MIADADSPEGASPQLVEALRALQQAREELADREQLLAVGSGATFTVTLPRSDDVRS